MARTPKVFTWSDGFHRYVVAATSRTRALEAWGFDRDLFKEGAAQQIENGPGFDQALADPGKVIEIDVSSGVESATRAAGKAIAKTRPPGEARDRRKLQTLKDALKAEDAAADADSEAFAARRQALDAEEAASDEAHAEARRKITTAIAAVQAKLDG